MSEIPDGELSILARLPCHPLSVRAARSLVGALRARVEPDEIDRLELIVSELVTNAVRHGAGGRAGVEMTLSVHRDQVSICVQNPGPPFTFPDVARRSDRVGGFGLHITRQLADTLEIERINADNVVRAALSLAGRGGADSDDPGRHGR